MFYNNVSLSLCIPTFISHQNRRLKTSRKFKQCRAQLYCVGVQTEGQFLRSDRRPLVNMTSTVMKYEMWKVQLLLLHVYKLQNKLKSGRTIKHNPTSGQDLKAFALHLSEIRVNIICPRPARPQLNNHKEIPSFNISKQMPRTLSSYVIISF